MRKGGLDLRLLLGLLALLAGVGVIAVFAIGGSSGASGAAKQARAQKFDAAGLLTPIRAAPPLALHNYLGEPVNIADYKGRKAVLVTFLYTHCPDICPLITSQLRVAQNLLGAGASKVQLIAVSVDPKGDTRQSVAAFLARHEMTGRMLYLTGSQRELAAAWSAWGVGSERDAQNPEFVNHSGLIFGIGASGKRITLYAPSFQPAEVAHDVPLLAKQ